MKSTTKFKFLAVTKPGKKKDENDVLAIVNNKDEATEYIIRHITLVHGPHFKMWCEIHNYDVNDYTVMCKYCDECVNADELDSYCLGDFIIDKHHLASVLRIVNGSIPVGASYETDEELERIAQFLDDIVDKEEK